jgi:hypothetical protein
MKIRNFEYFASRVARKFGTVIQRSVYNGNSVWFANGMYMNLDGEFLYISDYSNGVNIEVMSVFVYCYNTQKDFFHDLDLLVSSINTTAKETADTNGEDITESTEPEEPEETVKDIMEVKQSLNARFGKEQCFDTDSVQPNNAIIAKIEDINHCPNQNTCCIVSPYVHCDYNYKSEACIKAHKNFNHYCEQVHKHIKATHNPEWHHVSLAKLATIDNDMLDEKRRNYIFLYHLIKDFRKYAFEIKREDVYFDLVSNVLRHIRQLYFNNVISYKAYEYAVRHVHVVSVEKGYFMAEREKTFGFKESRRYNGTLR